MANFNFNKVIIGGRLCSDPELKTTQSGISVTSFNVAVSRRGGSPGESITDFFTVTAWRGTAEFVTKYFRKGSSICVTGTLQMRSWNTQNGEKRIATAIVADEVTFVDAKGEVTSAPAAPAPVYTSDAPAPKFEVLEDDSDLPF